MASGNNLNARTAGSVGSVTNARVFSHPSERAGRSSARLLLLVPFVGVLWAPSSHSVPALFAGVPFAVVYSMLWVAVSAAVVYTVYRAEN